MSEIIFSIENGVGKIILNRPNVFNSVNRALALAFQDALSQCAQNQEVRAVLVTGEGKAFCAGQDLQEATDPNGPSFETLLTEHFNPIVSLITSLEKPVVCAVNGVAAGAGANIALCCDITIAKESSSFIQAFANIGLVPDSGGTWLLPRLIGRQKAVALAMLGEKVSATDAEALGMIYKVLPDDEYQVFAEKLAMKLAQMPTKGLAMTKKLFELSANNSFQEQLACEKKYQIAASETADYKEGVSAFLEKRKPVFKGK